MLRLAEFGLFLLPFAVYAVWMLGNRRLRPLLLWSAAAGLVTLAGLIIWFGMARSLDKGERYVPAHVEDGRIVPGHGEAIGKRAP